MKQQISGEKLLLLCLMGMVLFCFAGPLFSPYSLIQTQIESALQPPSTQHFLGTDSVGRDILTRLMYGGRVSLVIGAGVAFLELILGGALGMLSGYMGGWFDRVVMGITDAFLCVPVLPSVLVAAAILSDLQVGSSARIVVMILVMALMGWPYTARMVRSQVLQFEKKIICSSVKDWDCPCTEKCCTFSPVCLPSFRCRLHCLALRRF